MRRLGVIIVSYNSAPWFIPCLESLYLHAGDVELDVVVVDNGSSDDSVGMVERGFPKTNVVRFENRGFGAGNNVGLKLVDAPFVLFLNPDTEVLEGAFDEMLDLMERRPSVGLVGCRQVAADGSLHPTIRRFPSAARYLCSALGSEHLPFDASWFGERVRDQSAYDREVNCDWTSGSFMLARAEAVRAAGCFDERYFIYSEEPDLCLRLRRLGWGVRHVPAMTILHHAGKAGLNERLVAQDAYARRQYLVKNLAPWHRRAALTAYGIGHVLRAGYLTADRDLRDGRRVCARRAVLTLLNRLPPPFEQPS